MHDAPVPAKVPENVTFVSMSWQAFRQRFSEKCAVDLPSQPNYKMCDAKVFLGTVFEEALEGYEYFGWGDLDLVYGELDAFLEPLLGRHSVISFHRKLLSNHFVLFRNTPEMRSLYRKVPDFAGKMAMSDYAALDDTHLSAIAKALPDAWFAESYTTPFVNWTPWADGTYNFPVRWEWHNGRLINDLDRGYTFPYFHFMVWKGGERFYYLSTGNWEELPPEALKVPYGTPAFALDQDRIRMIRKKRVSAGSLMGLSASPAYNLRRRLYLKIRKWWSA